MEAGAKGSHTEMTCEGLAFGDHPELGLGTEWGQNQCPGEPWKAPELLWVV